MALRVYDSRQGIDFRFNAQLMQQQQEARNALRAIVTTVLHLAQQGVALRGHDESSGNFDALLELRASDDASLKNWLDNHRITWTSHEIQNEILKTASHEVQRLLASQMKRAGFFGIMVDETTDAASLEEVSICLRTTTEDLEPVEHFIGFVQTNSTTGAALADLIVDTITRLNLDIHLCRSQTYDGASNMRGAIKGVQARMLEVERRCFFTYCANHRLNLILQAVTKETEIFKDCLGLVHEIGKLFKESSKRISILQNVSINLTGHEATSIRPLCETRWTVREAALDKVIRQYEVILQALEEVGKTASWRGTTVASTSRGLVERMSQMETYYGLLIARAVFGMAENAASALQKPTITHADAQKTIQILKEQLAGLGKERFLEDQWSKAAEVARSLDLKLPELPRVRQPTARALEAGIASAPRTFTTPKEKIFAEIREAISSMDEELQKKFASEGATLLSKAEEILCAAAKGNVLEVQINELLQAVGDDLSENKLRCELGVMGNLSGISDAKTFEDIRQVFHENSASRELMPEVTKLMRIILCAASSTATSERSFSMLRRLKKSAV